MFCLFVSFPNFGDNIRIKFLNKKYPPPVFRNYPVDCQRNILLKNFYMTARSASSPHAFAGPAPNARKYGRMTVLRDSETENILGSVFWEIESEFRVIVYNS